MSRRNILFVFCDQFLWNATGYAGHPLVRTPNLDRLAERSVNLTHTYAASPVCVSARAALFTGLPPHANGVLANQWQCPPETPMFLEPLREAGLHTAAIGKLHFRPASEIRRFDHVQLHDGFASEHDECPSEYIRWLKSIDPALAEKDRHSLPVPGSGETLPGRDLLDSDRQMPAFCYGRSQLQAEHFYTQWISDQSIRYLREHRHEPFFLFCSFFGPHSPFFVPPPYDLMYDPADVELPHDWRETSADKPWSQICHHHLHGTKYMSEDQLRRITALYFGHISLIDEHVGRILRELASLGLGDETVIAFSADHGELLGRHGLLYKNFMYDESLRIPLLIHEPGQSDGCTRDGFVSQIDILPTLLDLAGIPVPTWSRGRSMMPLLHGDLACARSEIFAEMAKPGLGYLAGYRNLDWMFAYEILKDLRGEGELYDLRNDPMQSRNLYHDAAFADRVEEFRNRILVWMNPALDVIRFDDTATSCPPNSLGANV